MSDIELLTGIRKYLKNPHIKILNIRGHAKASEEYADVEFLYPNIKTIWKGSLPYNYRRAGLSLHEPQDIAKFLETSYESLLPSKVSAWKAKEKELWESKRSGKEVTKSFFDSMLNLKWNCVNCDFPKNPNWARRTQDIKEMGYLLSTNRHICNKCKKNTTHILLIPMAGGTSTGYETWSIKLKTRIIDVLGKQNIYEDRQAVTGANLIPDHKFPEIRWDEKTREKNLDKMTGEEIKKKFQLLDNQRNLQKREVCRKCYQTDKRGTIFGINYFYSGTENWSNLIPKRGKDAEEGCVGCPWYDLKEWRRHLNELLEHLKKT